MQQEATPRGRPRHEGIEVRHGRRCRSSDGGKCNCTPSYRASTCDKRTGQRIRETFRGPGALAAAKGWRSDAITQVRRNRWQPPTQRTLREVGDEWLDKAKRGEVRSRRRNAFKGSTLRGYENALKTYVYPDLGHRRLSDIRLRDVQELVERLNGQGLSGQTVLNAIMPLRVIVRYARRHEGLIANPTEDLDLPEPGGRRERAETAAVAAELIEALPDNETALFACAFYAGLRRGELRALRVRHLRGLDGQSVGVITVEHSWDDKDGEVAPKSKAGAREVPMPETLRRILVDYMARTGRTGDDFIFGRTASSVFRSQTVANRTAKAWTAANVKRSAQGLTPLVPITLHECRHSYSSFLDAAGISEARADRYMGHSNRTVAARYRHQLDGQLAEDAKTLERYLSGEGNVIYLREAS